MRFSMRDFAIASLAALGLSFANAAPAGDIRLELSPKLCTLSGKAKQCETVVRAEWRSPREESLCLVLVDRPEIKRCWENYSEGVHSMSLVFADDLLFELRDPALSNVLASEVLHVIREALEFRRKRRQPWNILY